MKWVIEWDDGNKELNCHGPNSVGWRLNDIMNNNFYSIGINSWENGEPIAKIKIFKVYTKEEAKRRSKGNPK